MGVVFRFERRRAPEESGIPAFAGVTANGGSAPGSVVQEAPQHPAPARVLQLAQDKTNL